MYKKVTIGLIIAIFVLLAVITAILVAREPQTSSEATTRPTVVETVTVDPTTSEVPSSQPTEAPSSTVAAKLPVQEDPCSADQLFQPSASADGGYLVCVQTPQSGYMWVTGPEPLGVGTAEEGGYCTVSGGQDSQGRVMNCFGNRWYYGE